MIEATYHHSASGHTEIITEYWDLDFYLKYDIMGILRDYLKSHPNNHKVLNLIETIQMDQDYVAAMRIKAASTN